MTYAEDFQYDPQTVSIDFVAAEFGSFFYEKKSEK